MSWPSYYTYNFNPNPSAEVDLTGYSTVKGTEQLSQDPTPYAGQYSVMVTTPGNVTGEGVITPAGSILANATGSASLWIYGQTGNLLVTAIQNPGGQVLGSFPVLLDGGDWQRVELDNLAMTANGTFYLVVSTTGSPQAVTFWIDAVQYEPESPSHGYIDGDSPNCNWTGTEGESTSYRLYRNPTTLNGAMRLEGSITVVAWGEVFQAGPLTGQMDMSGQQHPMAAVSKPGRSVIPPAIDPGVPGLPWEIAGGGSITVLTGNPAGAFSDFAVFETGVDPDPAMTLIGWNNAGTQNANQAATAWTQLFGSFSAPQQQLDSGGHARWQAAAFMAAGFRIASQAAYSSATAPNAVNFSQVQVEKATQNGPTAYQRPRSLNTIIRPTRMNYCTNPSMQVSLAGWTAIGGATLTRLTSGGYQGSNSLQVSVPAAGGGVYIVIPDLILGDTFIASAYIEPVSANINDVTMSIASAETSSAETDLTYGQGSYGSGTYGGVLNAAVPMTTGGWNYRPYTPFAASQSTLALSFVPTAITGATYPLVFNIDAVLVEPGEVLNSYADGGSEDWGWEYGGTAGLTRSYYYERESAGVNAVQGVLQQHLPLGITAYAPQFFVPPTQ